MIRPRNISGFADYNEAENYALSNWLQRIRRKYILHGFSELLPRPLELNEVLLAKGGIEKQIFNIARLKTGMPTDMSLPFDRTIPMAHWVAKHANEITFPYKRYDISYSFRGERAQAGRFQGFIQADIDIIGKEILGLNADAECISTLYHTVRELKIGTPNICISHIGLTKELLRSAGVDVSVEYEVFAVIDDIPKVSKDETIGKLTALVDSQTARRLAETFTFEGDLTEFRMSFDVFKTELSRSYLHELEFVVTSLNHANVDRQSVLFKPCIVRGLNYYTGCVFETFLEGFEKIGSVASGGRYEDLASSFSKARLPGVGGSIGVTRLFDVASKNGLIGLGRCVAADIFVGFADVDFIQQANITASFLRKKGMPCDVYSGSGNLKKQLSYADKKGFRYAVVSMNASSWIVKDLGQGRQVQGNGLEDLLQVINIKI